jgi:GAF domain-containing protein/DNA-binding response OmpR family regulator
MSTNLPENQADLIFGSRLQRRIMWRVGPLVFVMFVALALVGVLIFRQTQQQQGREANISALESASESVEQTFETVITDLNGIAFSSTVREYAVLVQQRGTSVVTPNLGSSRQEALRNLDALFTPDLRFYYQSVTLLEADGTPNLRINSTGVATEIIQQPDASAALVDDLALDMPVVVQVTAPVEGESAGTLVMVVPFARPDRANELLGAVQLEMSLQLFVDRLEAAVDLTDERRLLLVDSNDTPLVDTAMQEAGPLLAWVNDQITPPRAAELENSQLVSAETITAVGGASLPWRAIVVDDQTSAITQLNLLTLAAMTGVVVVVGLLLLLLNWLLRPVTRPVATVGVAAQRIAAGDRLQTTGTHVGGRPRDEVGGLFDSLEQINGRIDALNKQLDEQSNRRERELEVAGRIGREVATLYEINTLLSRSINLICDEFGYYHAQIFLVDDAGVNAVLVQSRGRAGQQLLKQNFKIRVGSQSVIGRVIATQEPVMVNDVHNNTDIPHRPNPELPMTRAELGLPLVIKDRAIGALDIQSKEANIFEESNLPIYRLLADQLAVAIYNARLVGQTETRIDQIDTLNRQLTRVAWEDAKERLRFDKGYRYNLLEVEPAQENGSTPESATLHSEIRIRNEVIGYLTADAEEDQEFTDGDRVIINSIADRVALAIENARLFQQTQFSLMETSTLYQLSRYLNEANTLEDIIDAVIVSVMPDAVGGQIWIFDDYHSGERPEWMELQTDLANGERPPNNEDVSGVRVRLSDHPFFEEVNEESVALIGDVRNDTRLDTGLRLIFRRLSAESVVLIPLSVRGAWRGLITIEYDEPREFSDREGRIYTALIGQAGVAIDNRLLLQQTEEEVARNENLYAASRIINTAQNMQDLVYAAVATSNDPSYEFSLSLLEGELDETGWPTRARLVAESAAGHVFDRDEVYPIHITQDSPMRAREPETVIDEMPGNENVSRPIKWIRDQGLRLAAYFPLFSMNQPIAIFHVMSAEAQELSPGEQEVYRALTGQMSSQIQIRGLLERTESALGETRRLYVATQAINTAPDTPSVYEAVIEHLARPFLQKQSLDALKYRVELALLLAWPEARLDAPLLEYTYAWSSTEGIQATSDLGERVSAADFPYLRLVEDGPLYLPDVMIDDYPVLAEADYLRAYLDEQGTRTLLIQPVRSRQQWFGVIVCRSDNADAFDEQYRRFVAAIADQMALSVENQRLFDQARNEAERAQTEAQRAIALVEAAQLASRIGDDFERSLSEVFERAAREAGFDRWMLLFLDDTRENLEKITVEAPGFDNGDTLAYTIDTPIPVVEVVRQNNSLIVNDPLDHLAFRRYGEIERQGIANFFGKHIAMPVQSGGLPIGSMFLGRSLESGDLDERDEQFVETLAAQVAVAVDNRRLFESVQREQRNLRAILETLPAGVLVLDPETLKPAVFNQQAQEYLGREIDLDTPFSVEGYNLYRTGTQMYYPQDEMAIFSTLRSGKQEMVDDVAIPFDHDEGQIDLQVSSAPIRDSDGNVTSIVAVFQDISNLRSLENTLQENLRETVANLEMQRQLTESPNLEDVLHTVLAQLESLQPTNAYLVVDQDGTLVVDQYMVEPLRDPTLLRPVLDRTRSVNISDVSTLDDLDETNRAALERDGIRALSTAPLRFIARDRTYGWLVITSDQAGGIVPDQQRQLGQLADLAATAIDNRLLIRTQQETVNDIRLLYTATSKISRATGDIEELTPVLQQMLGTLSPDYYAGYLYRAVDVLGDASLFNRSADDLEPLDFGTLFADYDVPVDGIHYDDLQAMTAPEATLQALMERGINAFAIVSLRPQDVPDGFLVVAFREAYHFTESNMRFLNTIAGAASIVFNNIALFEQTQATLEETSTLYQASKALSDATNASEILDVVVRYLIGDHVSQVFVALLEGQSWSANGASVEIAASWNSSEGVDLEGVTLTHDQFPAWDYLATDEVVTINDVESDDLDPMMRVGLESLDAQSVVLIPLRVPKRVIGVVWVGSRHPHAYNDRDVRTFRAFAEQASLSMEASYLLQQTERRARQLETSAQVSRNAGQILDLEVLMPQLVDLIQDAFGYDHVQIFLMDALNEQAMLRASTGDAGEQLLAINHKLAKGSASVIGQVTELGTPQIALDTAEADVVHQPNHYLPLTRSEMALPLIIKNEVVGALDVQSNQPNAFTDEDVNALRTLAAQISVAIDNANLYEAAQQQAEQMSFLFDVTSEAASSEKLDEALGKVAQHLYSALRALAVVIYLPQHYLDEQGNEFETLKALAIAGETYPLDGIEEIRLDDEDSLPAVVGRSKKPFVIGKLTKEEGYLPVSVESQSVVLQPLVTSNTLIGLIVVESARQNDYDYDSLQLLLTLSGSISAVVQSLQLLEELTRTNERLRELDKLKSDFLANMSHELRTPLNSIIGFSRVMLKGIDGPMTEMQEQDLTTIYNSGQHLLMLINDVLDQAKITANKLDLKLDFFEVKPLVEAVKSIGVGLVKDKNVSIKAEVAQHLPQAYGDEFRTRQILINLISNAAKFTDEGGIIVRAYQINDRGQNMIRIDVEDTGIGIAAGDLPLLFEAFRQVDSSLTRTQGGTGLGLPIAKSLTEMQGGEMSVESETNVGSIFSITLPIDPPEIENDDTDDTDDTAPVEEDDYLNTPTKPTMEMKALSSSSFGGPPPQMMQARREVLLIEDDKNMVDQFRRVLQREGFDVTTADHPSYAEAMVSNLRPNVIVMDVNFAEGQGWGILERLKDRDDTFDIPVVVVTLDTDSERAYQVGAFSFLQRPFMPEDLLDTILAAEKEGNMERILIIDDRPEDIRLLTQVLNETGTYRVFSAESGKEGVSLVARRHPDLIILDLRMPDMDGFAVLQELRSNPETANIPVMVVTGELEFKSEEQAKLSNVHVLHKGDISREEYDQFMKDVRQQLKPNGN